MSDSTHVSTHVARPASEVAAFVADPSLLPQWAAGLGGTVEARDGRWFADSPMGEVEVRFVPANEHGVVDHDVTLPDGTVVTNPMRVIADGPGCEVVFTVRRSPGADDEAYAADVAAVRADLETLRRVLEG